MSDPTKDPLFRRMVEKLRALPGASSADPQTGDLVPLAPPTGTPTTPGTPAPPPTASGPPPIDGTPPPPNLADDPADPLDTPAEAPPADLRRAPFDVEREAARLVQAIRLATHVDRRSPMNLNEAVAGTSLRSILSAQRGAEQRRAHSVYISDLTLSDADIVFGDAPDDYREKFAAFCYTLFRGYGTRFVDRHEAESPEEFLDRPGKVATNLTALIIGILSKLYAKPPTRTPSTTTPQRPEIAAALSAMWADPLFNATLLEADRLTRLLGTVAIRPFFDPTRPGKIRPWVFMSHQIRVLADADSPWVPAAVVERQQPFKRSSLKVVWTDKFFLQFVGSPVTLNEPGFKLARHGLGRVPHTILRDTMSFTSFFSEGRGRTLCPSVAAINSRLTNLHEIEALQGFSVAQITNPESSNPSVGPREAMVFRPPGGANPKPYGLEFKNPGAPIGELRKSLSEDISGVLRDQRIPEAALGAAIQQRQLSGAAIRATMAPLQDDLEERGRNMGAMELDLADGALRMRREYEAGFAYEPSSEAPVFTVTYAKPETPMDTAEQVKREEFDVATGVRTPADIMFEKNPERYPTRDDAKRAWLANLDELKAAGMPTGLDADKVDPNTANVAGDVTPPADPAPDALLSALEAMDRDQALAGGVAKA